MIETCFNFPAERFDAVIDAILRLPTPLAPMHFGNDEGRKNADGAIVDDGRFRAFVNKSTSGFFLYGERICFSFRKVETDFVIDIEGVNAQESIALIQALGPEGASFAYAADSQERVHRNRLAKTASYGIHEAWVGRDWRRYIPGVYWSTLIPEALINRHGASLHQLKSAAEDAREIAPGLWLLRFYDLPENWQVHADRLDRLCSSLPGMFSIETVRSRFETSTDFLEAAELLKQWR